MTARFGLCIAALAAVLSAVVVALRAGGPATALLVVCGATALLLAPLLASLSALRAATPALRAVWLGFGLAALPLSVLAKLLKVTTHHRPLGAVTFAFLALFVIAGWVAISLRVMTAAPPRWLPRLLAVVAGLGAASLLMPLVRDPIARAGVFDVGVALGSAAVLVLLPWPEAARALAQRLGPWLWATLVLVGLVSALGGAAAGSASPALAAALGWF
ncbi:MAG: hypothetical protein ACOY0T_33245 [Myxococcota bacterium]